MKFLIFSILLFSSINLKAQVWIDSGAVWHYAYDFWFFRFEKYEYVDNIMIDGQLCQKIENFSFSYAQGDNGSIENVQYYSVPDHYTYASGDTVFYYKEGNFRVLFDFGAQVGDTWVISVDTSNICSPEFNDTSQVIVTSVGSINLNNETYRTIELSMVSNWSRYSLTGTYVERFGFIGGGVNAGSLFPRKMYCSDTSSIIDYPFYSFRCFEDTAFALINHSNEDCDYPLNVLSNEKFELLNFTIYPNPTTDIINISGDNIINSNLFIYDLSGKLVLSDVLLSDKQSIALRNIKKGIYLLKIEGNGFVKYQKIVLE